MLLPAASALLGPVADVTPREQRCGESDYGDEQ